MYDPLLHTYSREPLPIDLPDEPMTADEIMGSLFTWRDLATIVISFGVTFAVMVSL